MPKTKVYHKVANCKNKIFHKNRNYFSRQLFSGHFAKKYRAQSEKLHSGQLYIILTD